MDHAGNLEFVPPSGQTYNRVRRRLAGLNPDSSDMPRDINSIRSAERILQTLDCVGNLACCNGCEVRIAPCPVAVDARFEIITKVLKNPDIPGVPSERKVLISAMDQFDLANPVSDAEYRHDVVCHIRGSIS